MTQGYRYEYQLMSHVWDANVAANVAERTSGEMNLSCNTQLTCLILSQAWYRIRDDLPGVKKWEQLSF